MLNLAKLENDLKNKDIRAQFKQEPLKQFAKQIVQYQNFTAGSALKKINYGAYSACTAKQYFCDGRRYIKTGRMVKNGKNPTNLYKYIDEFLAQKLQPLTPLSEERAKNREEIKPQKIEIPVVRKPQQPKQNNDKYGVLNINNNMIKIYNDIAYCKAYQDACNDFGKEVKIVKVEIKEIL